jgi:hypothetical protein
MQHVNVKFFVKNPDTVQLADVVGVFQSWIQNDRVDDLLIDVADYRHVPEGPGVILVGHHAFYSLDESDGRLGLLYNRRTVAEGGVQEQLTQAIAIARTICGMLLAEEVFAGKLEFDTGELQIIINDRNAAPNSDETLEALKADLKAALSTTLGESDYHFERASDPRDRFSVVARADKAFTI